MDIADAKSSCGMALMTDHATSYSHGADYPLALTLQYSGMGLWGRNYRISGPTEISYALLPHAGKWDQAKVWSADADWNQPLITAPCAESASKQAQWSLLNTGGSGFEVTALMVEDTNLVVRLFNAEGDAKPKEISFDGLLNRVDWVKLNGNLVQTLPMRRDNAGRTFVKLSMPRFGIATLRIACDLQGR